MKPTPPDQLIQEIGGYFSTFLQFGKLDTFSSDIDPELSVHGMDRLLRIHFLLRNDVIDFVEKLPDRIRKFRSSIKKSPKKALGVIDGKIDWQRTMKSRYAENPDDVTSFVIETREKDYNVTENLILKTLIAQIYAIVTEDLQPALEHNHPWISEWVDRKGLRDIVNDIFFSNIYMKRVRVETRTGVTERMLMDTMQSRNELYREASRLLDAYQKLMEYELDPEEAKELLRNTFIVPEKTEVLFQLYWTFRVIMTLSGGIDNVNFHILENESDMVAEWDDGEYLFQVFHNSSGDMEFHETLDHIDPRELDNPFFRRQFEVMKTWEEMGNECFGKDWTGNLTQTNPDILVQKKGVSDGVIRQIYLARVRYTNLPEEAFQGVKELMEFMAMIKYGGTYFQKDVTHLFDEENIRGWLFMDRNTRGRVDKMNISVVPLGEEIPY